MFSTQILKWGSFSFSLLNFGSRVIQLASWTVLCLDRNRDINVDILIDIFLIHLLSVWVWRDHHCKSPFKAHWVAKMHRNQAVGRVEVWAGNLGYFSAGALVASRWWVCSGGQHYRLRAKEAAALLSPLYLLLPSWIFSTFSFFVLCLCPFFFFLLFLINQSLLFGQLCCSDLRLCSHQLASSVGATYVPEC